MQKISKLEFIIDKIKEKLEEESITLKQLSIQTKIELKYIEAIINKEFSKIPEGPYLKLFIRDICKEIGLEEEYNKIVNKLNNINQKEKENKEEKVKSYNVFYIAILSVFLVLFIIIYFVFNSNNNKDIFISQIDSIDIKTTKYDSLKNSLKDSLKVDSIKSIVDSTKKIDSLVLLKSQDTTINKKDEKKKPLKEWVDPKVPQISQYRLNKKYPQGIPIEICARGGTIKIKYITRGDFWWKVLKDGECIKFNLPKAVFIDIYNSYYAKVKYKGKEVNIDRGKYVRYVFGVISGIRTKIIYEQ